MIAVLVIVAALVIAFMILTHELGHYFAAKALGVKVLQFSVGFGPEIAGWDRGETRYSLKWILAGGSVKILGMNPDQEVSREEFPRSYYGVPHWKRAIIVLAGSLVHLIIAFIFFYLVFWPVGYQEPTGRIGEVQKKVEVSKGEKVASPASLAGLKKGDLVVEVDGVKTGSWIELQKALSERPGERVDLKVKRGGSLLNLRTTLLDVKGRGILGVVVDARDTFTRRSNPVSAVWQAARLSGQLLANLFRGLTSLFSLKTLKMLLGVSPRGEDSPRSVVGAAQYAMQAAAEGPAVFMVVMGYLFLFLAIFNLLPIPPFDGGFLLVIIVEKLFKKTIDIKKLVPVAWAVIIILVVVAARLVLLDIFNPLKNPFQP